jgi:hypothetical protein
MDVKSTILSALLPVIVSLLLGFLAAWHHDFESKDATILNRMVLMYATPLAIFVGTVGTRRSELFQDFALFVTIFAAIVGLYVLTFLLFRFVFRFSLSLSALVALTASAPAVPFMGPAILGDLFGKTSALPIAIASLVINLTVVPVTILLLALGETQTDLPPGRQPGQKLEPSTGPVASTHPTTRHLVLAEKLFETVKTPIVWAPLLAFVLVLLGVRIPVLFGHSLSLLGQASGGVAMFACGIMLAAYKIELDWKVVVSVLLKNAVQAALVLGVLLLLGYQAPIVPKAVLTMAIPAMPIVVLLAVQYRVAEAYATSAVFLSVLGSIFTMGAFIALTL